MKIITKSLFFFTFFALILIGCEKENQPPNYETDTITDSRDGNIYNTVKIGDQWWMSENLAFLPSVSPPYVYSETLPYYYVYGYEDEGRSVSEAKSTANYQTYGVLYNWPAAMNSAASSTSSPSGVQGVCPTGWHLPSDAEWTQLSNYLGGESVAGGKLKETGKTHWLIVNTGASNESGFTALPGGYRSPDDVVKWLGLFGLWWSSSENSSSSVWVVGLSGNSSNVVRDPYFKWYGYSVRCLKD